MTAPLRPLITLTTDFGLKDHYVAAMKGVILGICPEARIVDLSHLIVRHDVIEASYILSRASPYFPEATIHLVVVDPGVGTNRRRLAIQGRRSYFIGPDNGVLIPAARMEGILRMVEIVEKEIMLASVSATFEGRDVFAPAAAYLARGADLSRFGPAVDQPVEFSWGSFEETPVGVAGQVIHVDSFGNIITNISATSVQNWEQGSHLRVRVGTREESMVLSRSYGEVPEGNATVILGSGGLLEIAVNRGSAGELFKARAGARIMLEKESEDDRGQ